MIFDYFKLYIKEKRGERERKRKRKEYSNNYNKIFIKYKI